MNLTAAYKKVNIGHSVDIVCLKIVIEMSNDISYFNPFFEDNKLELYTFNLNGAHFPEGQWESLKRLDISHEVYMLYMARSMPYTFGNLFYNRISNFLFSTEKECNEFITSMIDYANKKQTAIINNIEKRKAEKQKVKDYDKRINKMFYNHTSDIIKKRKELMKKQRKKEL